MLRSHRALPTPAMAAPAKDPEQVIRVVHNAQNAEDKRSERAEYADNSQPARNSAVKPRLVSSLSQAIRAMNQRAGCDSEWKSDGGSPPRQQTEAKGRAAEPFIHAERAGSPPATAVMATLRGGGEVDGDVAAASLGELIMLQETVPESRRDSPVARGYLSASEWKHEHDDGDGDGDLSAATAGIAACHYDRLLAVMQEVCTGSHGVEELEKELMQETNKALESFRWHTDHRRSPQELEEEEEGDGEDDDGGMICRRRRRSMKLVHSSNKQRSLLMAWVMRSLRASGYNAAICSSSWNAIEALVPAGSYEYIDVVWGSKQDMDRLIVDVNFRAQFEIARASPHYNALLAMVPFTFVGRPRRLHLILKTMSRAAKLSLKLMGMHLPPWRKYSYLRAKWFSPHINRTSTVQPNVHAPKSCSFHGDLQRIHCTCSHDPFSLAYPNHHPACEEEEEEAELHRRSRLSRASSAIANFNPNEIITVFSTTWKLPAPSPSGLTSSSRKRVSALADALREQTQANLLREKSALHLKFKEAAMAC